MKLSELNPGDTFKTDTNKILQVMLLTKADIAHMKRKKLKNHIKVKLIESGESYFFDKNDRMIISKIK